MALIARIAQLIAESSAAKSQAESASRNAAASLKAKDDVIIILKKDIQSALNEKEGIKRQAESVSREYDNLLKEHAKSTSKLDRLEYTVKSSKDK